jgi:hypothetical protein
VIDAPPVSAVRTVRLHRSRHGVVLFATRAVLLPVCVAILGHDLATRQDWTLHTKVIVALLAAYVVGAFIELVRSLGVAEISLVDGKLVLFTPSLLRAPVAIESQHVCSIAVTPRGWFGYSGRLPYTTGDTAAVTPDRPDLGASIRAVITLAEPVALAWRKIPGPRGDLCRGRSMPRAARRIVLSVADRDLASLHALLEEFSGAPLPTAPVAKDDRARDVIVMCRRVAAGACAVIALLVLTHSHHDPLDVLRPGVCLDAPNASTFAAVDVQPCTSPHTAEVVGVTIDANVASVGASDCVAALSSYAGASSAPSGVHVQVLRDRGSSDGVCIAILPGFVSYSLQAKVGTTV